MCGKNSKLDSVFKEKNNDDSLDFITVLGVNPEGME